MPSLTPSQWPRLARIAGEVHATLSPIRIACDVTNPLLGLQGAAAVYAPQKGLRAEDYARLDQETARVAALLCAHCDQPESLHDTPGSGAAGGIAFGLMCATRARLLPGFGLVSAWLRLEARLAAADVVITGEGRFDESSLCGKGPGAVAQRALELGKPVHVFAGQVAPMPSRSGLYLHGITPSGTNYQRYPTQYVAPEVISRWRLCMHLDCARLSDRNPDFRLKKCARRPAAEAPHRPETRERSRAT
jgi:glycerate kinase